MPQVINLRFLLSLNDSTIEITFSLKDSSVLHFEAVSTLLGGAGGLA